MSLYQRHQHYMRMVEWSGTTALALPVTGVMYWAGFLNVVDIQGGTMTLIAGAAVVSWIGLRWHRKAKAALRNFETAVNGNDDLTTRYMADAEIGQIEDLRSELAVTLTMAAAEAKRGHAISAGYLYGHSRNIESRLRQRRA